MALYQLSDIYRSLREQYNDCETQEELDAIVAQMELIEVPIEEKLEEYAKEVKNQEADAEMFDTEIKRLSARKYGAEQKAKELELRMKQSMELTGLKKTEAGIFKIAIQTNGGLPKIKTTIQAEQAPKEFKRLVPSYWEFNPEAIAKAFKEGKELPEGIMCERGTHLRIR